MHFALHQDTYKFGFSPAALENELGISKDRCRKAFNKLVEAGYLVRDNPDSNGYTFYQLPPQYEGINFDADSDSNTDNNNLSLSPDIPVSAGISPPTGVDTPTGGDRYTCPQREGVPADKDRLSPSTGIEILQDNTSNNTTYITDDNTEVDCPDNNHSVSVMDGVLGMLWNKYGYGTVKVDENGEWDFTPSFFHIPTLNHEEPDNSELPF